MKRAYLGAPLILTLAFILVTNLAVRSVDAADSVVVHLRQRNTLLFAAAFDRGLENAPMILSREGSSVLAIADNPFVPEKWAAMRTTLSIAPYGPGSAASGLNDRGLVVHLVFLDDVPEGSLDPAEIMHAMQWVRFALDRHDKVSALVNTDAVADIVRSLPVQIVMCDKNGICAVVDRHGDNVERRWGELLPYPLATGASYDTCLHALTRIRASKTKTDQPEKADAVSRFIRAADLIDQQGKSGQPLSVDKALDLLAGIVDGPSPFRITYDQRSRRVVVSRQSSRETTAIELRPMSRRCGGDIAPVSLVSLDDGMATLSPLGENVARSRATDIVVAADAGPDFWAKVEKAAAATACLADDVETAGNPHQPLR